MTLLVVGEAITAFMRTVDSFDSRDPFEPPVSSGAPMIFASVAGRLGADVVAVGAVGDDLFGVEMASTLEAHGVDTSGLLRSELPTTIAFVTYDRTGDRRFSFYLEGTACNQVGPGAVGDRPERADWLHVSGSALTMGGTLPTAVSDAARRVRAAGGRLSVDPNVRVETASTESLAAVRDLVHAADVVLPSTGELAALGLDAEALVAEGKTVITTRGADDVEVRTPEHRSVVRPAMVDVVNADGAGDTFAAGAVVGLRLGWSVDDAVRLGCDTAAIAVQTPGPMDGELAPVDSPSR